MPELGAFATANAPGLNNHLSIGYGTLGAPANSMPHRIASHRIVSLGRSVGRAGFVACTPVVRRRAGRAQAQALDAVGLGMRGNAWPSTLSGGQRRPVAPARALVHRPRLLLLDELLGALDASSRIVMQQLIVMQQQIVRLWR